MSLLWVCILPNAKTIDYVNLFMGTSGDNGQVSPGATVPFGMVCVCPDSDPRQHAGYDYAVDKISGISINRLSGVGCSGCGGNLRVFPAVDGYDLRIVKGTEKAIPGYYEATFNNQVKGEFTATKTVAVERYTFPKGMEAALTVDFASSFERIRSCTLSAISDRAIEGVFVAPNTCGHGSYKLYFYLTADRPFRADTSRYKARLSFEGHKPVEIRIAVSPLDVAVARQECRQLESAGFETIRKAASAQWEKTLSGIQVKGGSRDDKVIFFTSLYRVCLSPQDVTAADGRYLGSDGNIYKADGFRYFSSWSLWDTFRTKFPLLVLTEPALMRDMAVSLIHLYKTGKKNWSTPFEPTPNVRTEHAAILLLDAYRKGITDLDFRIGYEGMKKEAAELLMKSPDQKIESVYDLWAMSQIAEIIGEKEDAARFKAQSEQLFEETWNKEFRTVTPEFSVMKNNGLYQGTRWQYRWAAPQYIDRMIELVGKDSLCAQLDYFFEQHLYNQGNEPDIHVPYLFNRFGAPEKTQQIVYRLMQTEMLHCYGGNSEFETPYEGKAFKNAPEGYCPEMDEDDGTMSAWYVFGAMGFYPLLVGGDSYELVSPLFDSITLAPAGGKLFRIKTVGRKSPSDPVRKITVNGKEIKDFQLSHAVIRNGGVLTFYY